MPQLAQATFGMQRSTRTSTAIAPKGSIMTAQSGGKLTLGTAPDSWGIWFPEDEQQIPWNRFLDEVAEAGYAWLELGPYGYLPTNHSRLSRELAGRGLKISGGTMAGALHRSDEMDRLVDTARAVAELTAALGAHHLVFIPRMFRDEKTGEYCDARTLDDAQWATLAHEADELGMMLLHDYDIRLCLHSHADSHILTQPEIERFLDNTAPDYVWLCLDTGHVVYGGGDPVDLIRRYPHRIGYVHIKQIDRRKLETVIEKKLSFAEAVRHGVCVTPPSGDPNTASVIAALQGVDAGVFAIVEQDLYPCAPDVPLPIAVRTREYLNSCGLKSGRT
jgi:inosose dehydratase